MRNSDSILRNPISDRTPRPLDATLLGFDLEVEVDVLKTEDPWRTHRHNARTLVKHEGFRIVIVLLGAGARVQGHETYKHIAVHALTGRLRLHILGDEIELGAGALLSIDRCVHHDIEGVEESAFLLHVGGSGD